MTAETLRRAATLMRGRAEAATRGPWRYPPTRGWQNVVMSRSGCLWAPQRGRDGALNHAPDGHHIASWHPAVALAVADWLDLAAEHLDIHEAIRSERPHDPNVPERVKIIDAALAVAVAYLGEDQP